MAGNNVFTGQDGNIYVDFDVQNLIVVDPNKIVDNDGKIRERSVQQENLVMYANLETKLIPRTKLAVGASVTDPISTVSIADINFMKPGGQKYLTNEYTNEITGEGVFNKGTTNKTSSSFNPQTKNKPTSNITNGLSKTESVDTGLLGITSINVKINTSFIPEVTIELEDVQGRALFEKGDLSPYAAFFQMPYPPFYLTLKGFYGQAIRYQLNLISFNARFNSFSGNYQVTLLFYGYKFNILNEISLGNMFAVPHMYESKYSVSKKLSDSTNSVPINQFVEGGTLKIQEVYADYKSKGLIPKDFPELSVNELLNRLELFIQNIQNSWTKADVQSLTDSKTFKGTLNSYLGAIYSNPTSWFNTNCDVALPIILKGGLKGYFFKKAVKEGTNNSGVPQKETANATLKKDITDFNNSLNTNPTFGQDSAIDKNLVVENVIKIDVFTATTNVNQIDFEATYKVRNKTDQTPSPEQVEALRAKVISELVLTITLDPEGKEKSDEILLYVFEGPDRFTGLINKMTESLNAKAQAEEERLTKILAQRLESKESGIGFKPSIRNVITVIMASTEAFIRLLDDVHRKAWDKRNDPTRRRAVIKYPSSDAKDTVQIQDKEDIDPVYPWPQYFVEDNGQKGRYVIKYPGDRSVVETTKGYAFDKWPEVEFVEEFLKGYTERGIQVKDSTSKENEEESVNRLTLNGIEFPQTNLPYMTKEEVKFFFEIWERTYLNSHYNRFQRGGNVTEIYETIGNNEAENIKNALGINAPSLIGKLKSYGFNFNNFLGVLSHISNAGTGPSIQKLIRDIFATGYIQAEVDKSFEIYDNSTIGAFSPTVDRGLTQQDLKNFETLIKSAPQPDFCDTYPFTSTDWNDTHLETSARANNELFYNTKKTLFINNEKKIIANFTPGMSVEQIRPVTSFSYKNFTQPVVSNGFNLYYYERINTPSKYITTEGTCKGLAGGTEVNQTTSLLNTPYFVNSLQNGVQNWLNKEEYPYVQGAYLLLNSLPLSTLRGTYKTKGEKEPLDYIASSIKRFGGAHKLPYPWILKIGSIYHRYKRAVQDGVDILDTCWKDFDAVSNFDPVTNSPDKVYSIQIDSVDELIYLQGQYSVQVGIFPAPMKTQFVQGGFYPKLINDMCYFLNGTPAFADYSDSTISQYVSRSMKVGTIAGGGIDMGFTSNGDPFNTFKMKPWTCAISNPSSGSYYTIPSFGSNYNQVKDSIFDSDSIQGADILKRDILSNPSIFNGTVRSFWATSNFGYFDTTINTKPNFDQYLTYVNPIGEVQPLSLGYVYSNIEDIFGVFNKEQLEVMEQKFLDFCRPVYNIKDQVGPGERKVTLNVDITDPNRYLKNFQLMVREFFEIPAPTTQTTSEYLSNAIGQQFGNIVTILNNFMEYDIVMKMGNPSNYNRKLFDSFQPDYNTGYQFTNTTNGESTQVPFILVDPFKFEPYVPNSLPTSGGTTTVTQSIVANRDAWVELLLQMGPATIDELRYSDNGSYITDFFVDNNIEFTKNNVATCAPLIRIYATQKLKKNTLNGDEFKTLVQNYSSSMIEYHKNVFNNLFTYLQKNLPSIDPIPDGYINSSVEGDLAKSEMYEMFKSINDKWIAGNSYNEETLLQDFLFIDRASRNVGDEIYIDIFSLKNKLRGLNLNASVYTLIGSILTENHFSMMPLPAYVNYYGIQTPNGLDQPKTESSVDFANNLWGTFLSVDYRNSQPKLVCFYSERPSNYPDLGRNKDFRYKNDGYACNSITDNPNFEDQTNKTDWALSNRCVGFNVDMGLRNQNVFYSFSVSQDIGQATSESLIAENEIANQASGQNSVSQNVSLLNIYNNRSYSCNVVALGNALIQPMMYFCLNHVPMFQGAYLITEVNHQITPGQFQTSFTGVRQRVFSTIRPNSYLLSLNQSLLQKLPENLRTAESVPTTGEVNQTSTKTNAATNSCQEIVTNGVTRYRTGYESVEANTTNYTSAEFTKALADNIVSTSTDQKIRSQLAMAVYAFSFVSSADKNGTQFKSFGNNFSNVDLEVDWGQSSGKFERRYCCVNVGTVKGNNESKPFAKFTDLKNFIEFMCGRLDQGIAAASVDGKIITESTTSYIPTLDSMYQLYKTLWPVIRNEKQQKDFETAQGKEVKAKLQQAIESIKVQFKTAGINTTS